ncbi:MAG: hypothetical protein AAGF86_11375 [Pseudomonadota bacterium]
MSEHANDQLTQPGREAARESFSGRSLTSSQFNEAWAIAAILHEKIQATGSFRETLTDYAHAYARPERFDALRGETILRDIYQGRYGQSLNQTREGLIANEEALPDAARTRALTCAETIGELIQKAPTQPFYQAYDRAAVTLAGELQITQVAAKALMKESYQTAHNRDLYEAGKEIEDAYNRPVREKAIAERKAEQLQTRAQQRS